MRANRIIRYILDGFDGKVYQSLAILFCVLFGIAMIVNTQLAGEGWWFWYARLFHSGARLYADLHLALQPLYVLQTNAWMQLFGIKCLVYEIPSVIEVFLFCLAIFLILRESDWPDWQKSIVLASAFLISVACTAYRFDDYHIMADTFIFYSLVLLLMMTKADSALRQFRLAAGLGILSGLTITTRLTDGAALLLATGVCLLVLTGRRKFIVVALFVVAATFTALFIINLTGDTLSDYASNSIFRAADAKGGTRDIFKAPFLIIHNALQLFHGRRWIFLWVASIVAAGALMSRSWKNGTRYIIVVQLGMAGIAFSLSSPLHKQEVLSGAFVSFLFVFLLVVSNLLLPIVALRFLLSKTGGGKYRWDSREILVLMPLAALASASASTGAQAGTVFLSPIAMLLLLIPVIQPFRRQASWANASLVTIMALMGLCTVIEKIHDPYLWLLNRSDPMFVNRQWHRHPVYGPMYIDRDLLRFIEPVCQQIGQENSRQELLSMPNSYPNYFCNITPWHGYVQTFFDTSTRSTITHLMSELDTAPPQWIVYQRQLKIMSVHELYLHHGQRLAHRDLDEMIMRKIATGQWQVVSKSNYLFVDEGSYQQGDGWLIIRTRQ